MKQRSGTGFKGSSSQVGASGESVVGYRLRASRDQAIEPKKSSSGIIISGFKNPLPPPPLSFKNALPPSSYLKKSLAPLSLPTRKSDLMGDFLYKIYNLAYEVLCQHSPPHYLYTSTITCIHQLQLMHHKATSGRSQGAIIFIYIYIRLSLN